MQRSTSSSSSTRKKADVSIDLHAICDKKGNQSRPKSSLNYVHVIPVIVLLCLFVAWYYSYPVDLDIKDGRITAVQKNDMPQFVNETHVDLAILAKATPPNVSVSEVLITNNTSFAAQPSSGTD